MREIGTPRVHHPAVLILGVPQTGSFSAPGLCPYDCGVFSEPGFFERVLHPWTSESIPPGPRFFPIITYHPFSSKETSHSFHRMWPGLHVLDRVYPYYVGMRS